MEFYSERELKGIINTFSNGDITTDFPEDLTVMINEISKITNQLEVEMRMKEFYTYMISRVSNEDLISFINATGDNYWQYVDKSVQKELLMDYIDSHRDNLQYLVHIWIYTNGDVQLDNIEFFDSLIEQTKGIDLAQVWVNADPRIQLARKDIFIPSIIDKLISFTNEERLGEISGNYRIELAWGETTPELQEKLFNDLFEHLKENSNDIISMWKGTKTEIQIKHSDAMIGALKQKVDDYIEYEKKKKEKIDEEDTWGNYYEIDTDQLRNIKEDINIMIHIFSNSSEEIQGKEIKDIIRQLKNLNEWISSNDYVNICEIRTYFVNLWRNANPNIQTKDDFDSIISILGDEARGFPERLLVSEAWEKTSVDIKRIKLNELLDRFQNNPNGIRDIFKYTDLSIEIPKEKLSEILHLVFSDKSDEYMELLLKNYQQLENINSTLRRTINLDIITPEIVNEFGIDIIARMSNYEDIQRKFLENIKDKENIEIIRSLWTKTNDISSLNNLLENMSDYSNLLNELNLTSMNEEDIENIIDFLLQNKEEIASSDNLFGIKTVEQLKNFNTIRSDICNQILEGKTENLPDRILTLSEDERKKLAILELTYGIDLAGAKKLVEKFDFQIDDSNLSQKQQQIKKRLDNIRSVLESDDVEQFMYLTKNGTDELKSYVEFQTDLIDMMEEVYNESLYKPQEHQENILPSEQYIDEAGETHEIQMYEIREDFQLFARSEGAYNPEYQEPDNFYDAINRPSSEYHGNCESFISQELMAIAFPRGPLFGYSNANGILLAGPNDLSSNNANMSFDTTNTDTVNPPKFLLPKQMIDMTRHGHNEFCFERLLFYKDNNTFGKRMPNYVIWIDEEKTDGMTEMQIREKREKDDRWQMTKKAAAQLGIPIVVINREYFAEKEQNKVEDMQAKLMGKKKLEDGESKEQLIKDIIVKFENNAIGLKYVEGRVKSDYFTENKRIENYTLIENSLKMMKKNDPEQYKKCLASFISSLQDEADKYEYAGAQPPQVISDYLNRYQSLELFNPTLEPSIVASDEVSAAEKCFEEELREDVEERNHIENMLDEK